MGNNGFRGEFPVKGGTDVTDREKNYRRAFISGGPKRYFSVKISGRAKITGRE